MHEVTRYVLVKAILDEDDNIVPIWDPRIQYTKDEDFGPYVSSTNLYRDRQRYFIDVIFDLETKQLSKGVEIDLYPLSIFKEGEQVYIEERLKQNGFYRGIYESTIKTIFYTNFEQRIVKARDLEDYEVQKIKASHPDLVLSLDNVYCIKTWEPSFVLIDDSVITSTVNIIKKIVR